jgi:hypothetical protein
VELVGLVLDKLVNVVVMDLILLFKNSFFHMVAQVAVLVMLHLVGLEGRAARVELALEVEEEVEVLLGLPNLGVGQADRLLF